MPILDRFIELPLLRMIYIAFAGCLAALFVFACFLAAINFDWTSAAESAAECVNGIAIAIGAVIAMVIAYQRPKWSMAWIFWWIVAISLLGFAAEEIFNLLQGLGRTWSDDDYVDIIFLLVAPIGLYMGDTVESVPRISKSAMKCGLVLQCVSTFLDVGDGWLVGILKLNPGLIDILSELLELLFTEIYLFGLLCLLLSIVLRELETPLRRRLVEVSNPVKRD